MDFRTQVNSEVYSTHSLSGKERAKTERTLLCLLRGCQGYRTVVELRNETSIAGKILNCDGFMNLLLSNVTVTKISGEKQHFSELHVLGKNIRYVIIPDEIDIRQTIEEQVKTIGKTRASGSHHGKGKGMGRGRGRRTLNHGKQPDNEKN